MDNLSTDLTESPSFLQRTASIFKGSKRQVKAKSYSAITNSESFIAIQQNGEPPSTQKKHSWKPFNQHRKHKTLSVVLEPLLPQLEDTIAPLSKSQPAIPQKLVKSESTLGSNPLFKITVEDSVAQILKKDSKGKYEIKRSDLKYGSVVRSLGNHLRSSCASMFNKIKDSEFQNEAWRKSNKEEAAPNVVAMTQYFDNLSASVMDQILILDDAAARARVIEFFIDLQKFLLSETKAHDGYPIDFHTSYALTGAFSNSAISRLKKTWDLIPPKHLALKKNTDDLYDNRGNYRNLTSRCNELREKGAAFIPYLGLEQRFRTFAKATEENSSNDTATQKTVVETRNSIRIEELQDSLPDIYGYNFPQSNLRYPDDESRWSRSCELEPKLKS